VAFQYDAPNSQAPQSLLLAVPATWGAPQVWDASELTAIVADTMDLAKVRAVDPDALARLDTDPATAIGVGAVLPSLMFPADATKPGWARTAFAQEIDEWVLALESLTPRCLVGRLQPQGVLLTDQGELWALHGTTEFPARRYAAGISMLEGARVQVKGMATEASRRIYVRDYNIIEYPATGGPYTPISTPIRGAVRAVGPALFVDYQVVVGTQVYVLQGGLTNEALAYGNINVTAGRTSPAAYSSLNLWIERVEPDPAPTVIGIVGANATSVWITEDSGKIWYITGGANMQSRFRELVGSRVNVTGAIASSWNSTGATSWSISPSTYGIVRHKDAIITCL
jgi:hypothetical protein